MLLCIGPSARSAYARFPVFSAHSGADREGQQRVDMTGWPSRPRTTAPPIRSAFEGRGENIIRAQDRVHELSNVGLAWGPEPCRFGAIAPTKRPTKAELRRFYACGTSPSRASSLKSCLASARCLRRTWTRPRCLIASIGSRSVTRLCNQSFRGGNSRPRTPSRQTHSTVRFSSETATRSRRGKEAWQHELASFSVELYRNDNRLKENHLGQRR